MIHLSLTLVALKVVLLAEQRIVSSQIEDLSRRKLLGAHRAGKASQMVNLVPRFANVVLWHDTLATTRAFGSKAPKKEEEMKIKTRSRTHASILIVA